MRTRQSVQRKPGASRTAGGAAYERRSTRALAALWFVCVLPSHSLAEPPAGEGRAQLQVQAPSACVSAASISERVRARTAHVALVPSAAGVPVLRVAWNGDDARGLRAQLQVVWPDGRRSQRQLEARTCGEASDAIAFLIVLALDPNALAASGRAGPADEAAPGAVRAPQPNAGSTQPRAEGASAGSSSATASSQLGATALDTLNTLDTNETTDLRAASGAGVAPSRAAAKNASSERAAHGGRPRSLTLERMELSPIAQLTLGVTPGAMLGVGLQWLAALRVPGVWSPALQLRATRGWQQGWAAPGGVADFRLDALRVDACPLGVRVGSLAGRACVGAALGRLVAEGSATYAARSRARFWADSGVTLVLSADLGRSWHVGLNTGLALPWRRDSFAFQPEVFHRVAAVCWTSDLRIGVRFP